MSIKLNPKTPFDIRLGAEVEDRVTGFVGIAVSRVEYLTGCTQIGVQPKGEPGKNEVPATQYLDWQRLAYTYEKTGLESLAETEASRLHNGAGDAPTNTHMSPTR